MSADDDIGPSTTEIGIYTGGFISNFYHQFYNPSLFPMGGRPELEPVSPEVGVRFAGFLNKWVGLEAEGGVVFTSTKDMGDSAQIYWLGAQVIAQYPLGPVVPFVGAGFDMMHISSNTLGGDTDWPVHIGGGARFFVSKLVALRADLRFIRGPSEQSPYTLNASYGEFDVGVSFALSRPEVVLPPPPDPDPDHDGVLGEADKCPNEPGNGSPDGCPVHDRDGDGIPDETDKCPDQPETVNGFQDADGCPDVVPDGDHDGIDDLHDKCPGEPEDKDGFQDADGCPDLDNDNDGVVDAQDKCPNVAGPVENNGCPDTDTDKDGIVDRLDNCPNEPGTAENHGCKAKQLVEITKDQLKILDQVQFATGTARLKHESRALLENIARVLTAHPEIAKVRVEGFTDNVGKADQNQKLSDARAASVVAFLVKEGIAAERLEAIGHGQDNPIADNKTAKGRATNRRVEFNIPPAPLPPPPAPPAPAGPVTAPMP